MRLTQILTESLTGKALRDAMIRDVKKTMSQLKRDGKKVKISTVSYRDRSYGQYGVEYSELNGGTPTKYNFIIETFKQNPAIITIDFPNPDFKNYDKYFKGIDKDELRKVINDTLAVLKKYIGTTEWESSDTLGKFKFSGEMDFTHRTSGEWRNEDYDYDCQQAANGNYD